MSDKNLVRITFDRVTGLDDLKVEYGEIYYRKLTGEEEKELKTLEEHLANFKDFQTAEKLRDDQHKGVLEKKRRLEELKQLPTTPQLEWKTVSPDLINSIFLLIEQDMIPTYVENIPEFIYKKIFHDKPEININVNSPSAPAGEKEEEKQTLARNRVESAFYEIQSTLSSDWKELVTITVKQGEHERYRGKDAYWIKPNAWLQEDYGPIDDMVKKELGGVWQSKGRGDKDAHWEVLV